MFPVTITIHNIADLTAVMKAIGSTAVVGVPTAVSAAEKIASALGTTPEAIMKPNAILQDIKFVEAPGKPTPSAAPTQPTAAAPSPRTAAPTPPSGAPAAPAPSTEPPAAPPSTAADKPVAYADLQKAVLTLHKMDPTAAVPIAKALGADTFKLLPEAKWAEALAKVTEAIEARKAA